MRDGFAPAFNAPTGIVHGNPVDSGIGYRIGTRRFGRQTMHLTIDDIQHAAMGNGNETLTTVLEMQCLDARADTFMMLAPAFSSGRHMLRIVPPHRRGLAGKSTLKLGQRQAFATSKVPLAQLRQQAHGQPQRLGNRLRRMLRPQQVAAVQGIHLLSREMTADEGGLCPSVGVERNIDMPLHTPLDVPIRFAMTDKTDTRRFLHTNHHQNPATTMK